jgi:hypothetical protein
MKTKRTDWRPPQARRSTGADALCEKHPSIDMTAALTREDGAGAIAPNATCWPRIHEESSMIDTQDQQSNSQINAHKGGANDEVALSIPTNNDGRCPDNSATPSREAGAANEPSLLQRLRDRSFRAFDGTVFTYIESDRGLEMMSIRDQRFRRWLCEKLQEETGKRPSQATLTASIESLETRSMFVSRWPAVASISTWPTITGVSSRSGRTAGTSSTPRRYTLYARRACGRCRSRKGVGLSTTFGQ